MTLVRTQRGRMVHRADCPQILRGAVRVRTEESPQGDSRSDPQGESAARSRSEVTPWPWADGRSRDEVAAMVAQIDAKTCGHCRPLVWLE